MYSSGQLFKVRKLALRKIWDTFTIFTPDMALFLITVWCMCTI